MVINGVLLTPEGTVGIPEKPSLIFNQVVQQIERERRTEDAFVDVGDKNEGFGSS